jgi:hypothetical protein
MHTFDYVAIGVDRVGAVGGCVAVSATQDVMAIGAGEAVGAAASVNSAVFIAIVLS